MYNKISDFWTSIQRIFPFVEEETGPLSPKHRRLLEVLELIRIENFLPPACGNGRPPKFRVALARAFIAKILFRIPFDNLLRDFLLSDKALRIICGWESARSVPSLATFSRAFAEFAENDLPQRTHEALIKNAYESEIVGHVIIDSMPAAAREQPIKPELKPEEDKPRRRGRAKKGEERPKKLTRVERQAVGNLSPAEMLSELPKHAARAMKKKNSGCNYVWTGYKLHLASDDAGVPLVACTTSAIVNDHETGIPMALLAEGRCEYLYTLMDSAYDVKAVKEKIREMGHVPITDPKPYNPAQKEEKKAEDKRRRLLNWEPAERRRYRHRRKGERPNALLKDFYGAGHIYYRGHPKVTCHLMFGVLTLAATTLLGIL